MQLPKQEVDRFFKFMWSLQFYVNLLSRIMKLLSLLLILFTATSCRLLDMDFLTPDVQTLAQVEDFVGAPLPTGATEVQFEVKGFTDLLIQLRFTAPAAEVTTFLDRLGITLRPGVTPLPTPPSTDPSWWSPSTAQSYAEGALDNADGNRFYHAIVDQSDPALWIVYLQVSSR